MGRLLAPLHVRGDSGRTADGEVKTETRGTNDRMTVTLYTVNESVTKLKLYRIACSFRDQMRKFCMFAIFFSLFFFFSSQK